VDNYLKIQSDNNGYFVPGDSDASIGPVRKNSLNIMDAILAALNGALLLA
jgi:hypothetical protein